MAGLWQQLFSLWLGQALSLLLISLLLPTSGALPWSTKVSLCSLEGFEVVKRNFSRTFLRVGYHKIAEIPAGACNISIREKTKSRNYLALKTQSGSSLINGNWVIDRPGFFTAAGTQFTYRRPNEIRSRIGESITATGPLTDDLHVYLIYQQPAPSIYYEYSVPFENTTQPEQPENPSDILPLAETTGPSQPDEVENGEEVTDDDSIKENFQANLVFTEPSLTSDTRPIYVWIKKGHTPCSTTCGTGSRLVLWECAEKNFQATVPADLCEPALEPKTQGEDCNIQPCPAYWDVGEWSQCSRKCGPGTQHRQVICRQVSHVYANGSENSVPVAQELCGLSHRPVIKSTCQLKICSQWEIRSDWSHCSVPCGVGQRSREVVCVSNQGEMEQDEECNMNLKPDTLQNCDMGICARSWFTSAWSQRCSADCGQGNRTRTAVCLIDHASDLPLESCKGHHPKEAMSCDSGPCKNRLEWYTGPWGQCSAECGDGTQIRSAACILSNDGHMEVVDQSECSNLLKPVTSQPCSLKPCGVQWFVTEWSACSRSCSRGYRVRGVRCLSDNFTSSDQCDPSLTPENREDCNTQPCMAETNPSCEDQYHNCTVVVQARLCIYSYYRSVCCAACSRVHKSHPNSFQMTYIRR